MSDLGVMKISDVYRGIPASSIPTIQETNLSEDDKDLGTYYDGETQTTKVVTNTDRNKLSMGLLALVGFIFILGMMD